MSMVSTHSKNNILLVVRWPGGGIRTFMRYVYRNFDPGKWRFTIIGPETSGLRLLMEDLEGQNIVFVPVSGIPAAGKGFLQIACCVRHELSRVDYDIVHSHGFTSGVSSAIPSFLNRIPHLMTSHDVINKNQFTGVKGAVKREGMSGFFSLIDTIQSVSYDAQANLFSFFPNLKKKGKCIVIPNGIEVERFLAAEPRNIKKELGLMNDDFIIGFFGRFMSQKGFRFLVDAIELLNAREEKLLRRPIVVSFEDGGFIPREKRLIKEKGLGGNFHFMPFTPNVAGTIKGMDVVAMPSLWEACGLLAMETLVCGTPLIASNCIGLREVVRNTPAYIVEKGDSHSLSMALLSEMEYSRKVYFENYKSKAAEKYNVTKTSNLLSELYLALLTSSSLKKKR